MKLFFFLFHYFRRYAGWAGVAVLATALYAAATTSLIYLIEPIFGEVLLASGTDVPSELRLALPESSGGEGEGAAAAGVGPTDLRSPAPAEEPTRAAAQAGRARLMRWLDGGYRSLKATFGVEGDEVVYFVPILFLLLFLLRNVTDFFNAYTFQHLGLGATTEMRNDLYRRILDQGSRFHAQHPSGELVSRVVADVAVIQGAISNRVLDLFQQSVTLIALLALLLSMNLELALICLIGVPAVIYPIVRFGRGMRRTSHRSQERLADLANLVSESVRGHRVVKAFGMEAFESDRFRQATRRHLKVSLWGQILTNLSGPVVESVAVGGAAVLLIYAGRAVRAGELAPPLLISFLVNLLALYDPIRKLNKVNLVLQQSLAAAQRVLSLMEVPNEVVERPEAIAVSEVREGIAFRGLRFHYDHEEVLCGIDLEIHRGEIVALVGPSGAGKSTLVSLLPRFFDPTAGSVEIDGRDVRDLKLASLRSLIGLVTQETILFNDSIRNNIAYGRSDLPLERVREAAAAAYADEFISQLEEGYDTVIGEGGLRLSGGQRQRIAIARALLKNAPILILDEATSQLDAESESSVQKALGNLMQGRTTLVIAHRLATVTRADRIVVLERGRIVEEGSHRQLLERGGVYRRLYDLQFRP